MSTVNRKKKTWGANFDKEAHFMTKGKWPEINMITQYENTAVYANIKHKPRQYSKHHIQNMMHPCLQRSQFECSLP